MENITVSGRISTPATVRKIKLENGTEVSLTEFHVASNRTYGGTKKTTFYAARIWRRGDKLAEFLTKGQWVTLTATSFDQECWIAKSGANEGKAQCQIVLVNPTVELGPKHVPTANPELVPPEMGDDEYPFAN